MRRSSLYVNFERSRKTADCFDKNQGIYWALVTRKQRKLAPTSFPFNPFSKRYQYSMGYREKRTCSGVAAPRGRDIPGWFRRGIILWLCLYRLVVTTYYGAISICNSRVWADARWEDKRLFRIRDYFDRQRRGANAKSSPGKNISKSRRLVSTGEEINDVSSFILWMLSRYRNIHMHKLNKHNYIYLDFEVNIYYILYVRMYT